MARLKADYLFQDVFQFFPFFTQMAILCVSDIPLAIVQWVSKLSPREPGAGGTPAEGEHKEEKLPKIASASGSSENSEENLYCKIFQS